MWEWSRERFVILGESIAIGFLGFWMLEEYVNNVYLQDYVASFWALNWWVAPAALGALLVVGGISYYTGRGGIGEEKVESGNAGKVRASQKQLMTDSGVMVMDDCPFCNVPLRSVGEDRFHCRKCKRYFKR